MLYVSVPFLNYCAYATLIIGFCAKISSLFYYYHHFYRTDGATFNASLTPEETLQAKTRQRKLYEKFQLLGVGGDLLIAVSCHALLKLAGLLRCSPPSDTLSLCAMVVMMVALCATLLAWTHSEEMVDHRWFLLRLSDELSLAGNAIEVLVLWRFVLFSCTSHRGMSSCQLYGNIEEKLSLTFASADVTQYGANDILTSFTS